MNTPWQLGWTLYEGNKLIFEREDWLLWQHKFRVGVEAARITHFSWDRYKEKARPAEPIRDEFESI